MDEYILYTDRKENFSCDIALEGARITEAFARIILETNELSYVFNGQIDGNGKCRIPIRPLKGLMEVRDMGKMVLEVVADDTYFQPWESEFVVDAHKKLAVKVNEQSHPSKAKISVSINNNKKKVIKETKKAPVKKKKVLKETKPTKQRLTMNRAISEMGIMLRKNNINVTNFSKNKVKSTKLFTEYFTKNKISNKKKKDKILKTVIENIIRG